MAPPDTIQPKLTYKAVAKLEPFFTGGVAARATRDNKHLACSCGDEVKVRRRGGFASSVGRFFARRARLIRLPNSPRTQILDIATGTVARTLPGVSVFFAGRRRRRGGGGG
jgi:hypothetical protein